ncbi:carboxymuconolactone decarboxylase family protein [Helicovermis profundi]|uniref:Carboxymuconolactone decarboxylase-like domain-containing protein n=1 Tax=Helicovermis profundi TaxID=3065157 RepID=A0AAU9ETD9_9FIRM|nr:hypothetical protein HLPR_20410 [Clostridia bacterium S502]
MEKEKKKIMTILERKMGMVPKPLENMSNLDMDMLKNYLEEKQIAYSGTNLDNKTQVLIALSVGIALDSPGCIMGGLTFAKKYGATVEEILEMYNVVKFSKASSSISSFAPAMQWLLENDDE